MLVVNKMDTEGAWDKFKEIEKALHNLKGSNVITLFSIVGNLESACFCEYF